MLQIFGDTSTFPRFLAPFYCHIYPQYKENFRYIFWIGKFIRFAEGSRGSRQIWPIKVCFQHNCACNQDNVPSFSEQPFPSFNTKSNCNLFGSLNDVCDETFDKRIIKIWKHCSFLNFTKTRCKSLSSREKSLRHMDKQKRCFSQIVQISQFIFGRNVVLGKN